ncbi:pyridoxamine 5'-phosphate oxidase family protein [Gorillibacterium massiliense]|uniref:pyridoxamine 5'-phosphate oxidase family protein n=1 Tax=Gorillibacterium massiliense TaxID=1280390 RepID=UPI0005953915|nr:pyridoxamine 5'-phosphate oxidase family protein [Gorillibacterium massiliense]
MRRHEFSVEDWQEAEAFLAEASFGVLATTGPDGWPGATPINFVFLKDNLYIHGSRAGQKMEDIKEDNRVSFSIAKEYAIIPSYFTDPVYACPASAFFKSVCIKGKAYLVDDPAEKAEAMEAFMRKLQPEGGYEPITPEGYGSRLTSVAVVRIEPEDWSAKFKFGQNMGGEQRQHVMSELVKRDLPDDKETARLMELYCPVHKK